MRIAIISDIHSNLAAFEAVIKDFDGIEEVWCLGDVVGYGPYPNECVTLLRTFQHICIPGNHDWAAIGKMDTADFNPDARRAALWTGEQLTTESRVYLESLPLTLTEGDFTLAHGSPREPIWEYLFHPTQARANFDMFHTLYCLVGHTHVPMVFYYPTPEEGFIGPALYAQPGAAITLGQRRFILNPGGVGQPRDGNPDASYAILDLEAGRIEYRRVAYDIAATQQKMRQLRLPEALAQRLSYGW